MKHDHSKPKPVRIERIPVILDGPPGCCLVCLAYLRQRDMYHAVFEETVDGEIRYRYFCGHANHLKEGKIGSPWKKGDKKFISCQLDSVGHNSSFDFCIPRPEDSLFQGRDNDLDFYPCR